MMEWNREYGLSWVVNLESILCCFCFLLGRIKSLGKGNIKTIKKLADGK